MQKVIEENKSITKEIVIQFLKLSEAKLANLEDISEVYQVCKQYSFGHLKRLTSICIMTGDYKDYLHLKEHWKYYQKKYEIIGGQNGA